MKTDGQTPKKLILLCGHKLLLQLCFYKELIKSLIMNILYYILSNYVYILKEYWMMIQIFVALTTTTMGYRAKV